MPIYSQEAVDANSPSLQAPQDVVPKAASSAQSINFEGEGPLPIHWRGQKTYEEARVGRVFNKRRPGRYPAAVLKARTVDDVIRGVKLAGERGLEVAVRSGGHSWAGLSVRNKSILIDLEHLKELNYNSKTHIATASPSITGGELNPFLSGWDSLLADSKLGYYVEKFQLPMNTYISCPTVGIGGFLLQGGQGWGARGWGWSCEQIQSIDVVMPSGELITASETENSDVFWCARGAGPGFFGVVVRFRLKTRPICLSMHHTTFIIPAKDNYRAAMTWHLQNCRTLDPRVETVFLAFSRAKILNDQNPETALDAVMLIRGTALVDDEEEAKKVLEPFLQCPVLDNAIVKIVAEPTSLAEEYAQQLADNPEGRYYVDNAWLHGDDKDVVDSLEHAFTRLPSRSSFFLHYSMAPLRPLADMAFDIQTEHYTAGYIISQSEQPSTGVSPEDERCLQYLKKVYGDIDAKQGQSGGSPGQYTGDSELDRRPARIMSEAHWLKFTEIRKKHDPTGMFCGYLRKGACRENAAEWENLSTN